MNAIIDNVRQNESLYDDIDVTMTKDYDIGDREAPTSSNGEAVKRANLRTHYVSQNGMFRVEDHSSTVTTSRERSDDRLRMFDGEETRLLHGPIGNIVTGHVRDRHFIRPHMLLMRRTAPNIPLSVYLQGHKAVDAHPQVDWDPKLNMDIAYAGEGTYRDLKCQRVMITIHVQGSEQWHDKCELWLAEERNYIPVRRLAFTRRWSEDIPIGEGSVSDLREIQPGIWFPVSAQSVHYNPFALKRERKQESHWREKYVVEDVSLDPAYDRSFFRELQFPRGTAVYEIENGEIIKSYRVGAPGALGTSGGASIGNWSILWINLAFLGLIGSLVAFRRLWRSVRSHKNE